MINPRSQALSLLCMLYSNPQNMNILLTLHRTDESLATAPFINQWFKNPGDAEAPFNLGMKTSLSLWEWLEQPGNEWRAKRFATMMAGSSSQYPESLVTNGRNCFLSIYHY